MIRDAIDFALASLALVAFVVWLFGVFVIDYMRMPQ